MSVRLYKIEITGYIDDINNHRRIVFETRNALRSEAEHEEHGQLGFHNDPLVKNAEGALVDRGAQLTGRGGSGLEISKERLQYLAEHARTDAEIQADRGPHQMV